MPKFLKFIAVLVVLGALAVDPSSVSAQRIGNPSATTAAVTGTVTTNGAAVISLATAPRISVQVDTVSGVANTSNTVVTIDESVDGSNWVSTGKSITIANTGTTAAHCVSNWTDIASLNWRFNIQNGALAAVTNTVTITLYRK